MALPPSIRDAHTLGLRRNLTLSIQAIDFGLGVLNQSEYDLTTLRLGALMVAGGYEGIGADPARNYGGALPWFGSLPEVHQRLAAVDRRRQQAQAALDEALLDDDARAKREATATELRDALNALRTKISADPPYLRVVDRHNDDVDESTLTPLQQRALAEARNALEVEQHRRAAMA